MVKRRVDDPGLGPRGPLAHPAVVTPAQAAVLDLFRHGNSPTLTVGEIATQLAQHPNTIREHVDALVGAGLVAPTTVRKGRRGRPSQEYAVADDRAPSMTLRLIEALAEQVASSGAEPQVAVELGFAAGSSITEPSGDAGGRALLSFLDSTLQGWGFSTVPIAGGQGVDIVRCPMVAAARAVPEVVCGFHRGVIHGLAAGIGADPAAATLVEFDRPGSCRLVVTADPLTGDSSA